MFELEKKKNALCLPSSCFVHIFEFPNQQPRSCAHTHIKIQYLIQYNAQTLNNKITITSNVIMKPLFNFWKMFEL